MIAQELRYRALLIGNAWYTGGLADLKGPEHDVELLSAALTNRRWGLFRSADVSCMFGRPETEARKRIEQFFSAARHEDVLFLYFSGHGELFGDDLFLCTEETDLSNLRTTAIPARLISECAEWTPARRKVIVLDCCHSGAFKSSLDYSQLYGEGRFVLTSTYRIGNSRDASVDGRPGPFTECLAAALRSKASDDEGIVTFSAVRRYVTEELRKATSQRAGSQGDHFGDLMLARRQTPAASGGVKGAVRASAGEHSKAAGDEKTALQELEWPVTPTVDQASVALSQWADGRWYLPRQMIRAVTQVRDASVARLTVTTVKQESRSEREVTAPSRIQLLPELRYTGPIAHAVTPVDHEARLWENCNFKGWRRGSEQNKACGVCPEASGRMKCRSCNGRGTVKRSVQYQPEGNTVARHRAQQYDIETPCGGCYGKGLSACRRCGGTGKLKTVVKGRVVRQAEVKEAYVTERDDSKRAGPYQSHGSLEDIDLSGIPDSIREKLEDKWDELTKPARAFGWRFRSDLAILPRSVAEFDDGNTIRHAMLYGRNLDVAMRKREVLAIFCVTALAAFRRWIPRLFRQAKRKPAYIALLFAAVSLLVLLLVATR